MDVGIWTARIVGSLELGERCRLVIVGMWQGENDSTVGGEFKLQGPCTKWKLRGWFCCQGRRREEKEGIARKVEEP